VSLRNKAKQTASTIGVSWLHKLDEKTAKQVRDLWEGYREGEYSATHAWRTLQAEMPDIKISRSNFTATCNNVWGRKA